MEERLQINQYRVFAGCDEILAVEIGCLQGVENRQNAQQEQLNAQQREIRRQRQEINTLKKKKVVKKKTYEYE